MAPPPGSIEGFERRSLSGRDLAGAAWAAQRVQLHPTPPRARRPSHPPAVSKTKLIARPPNGGDHRAPRALQEHQAPRRRSRRQRSTRRPGPRLAALGRVLERAGAGLRRRRLPRHHLRPPRVRAQRQAAHGYKYETLTEGSAHADHRARPAGRHARRILDGRRRGRALRDALQERARAQRGLRLGRDAVPAQDGRQPRRPGRAGADRAAGGSPRRRSRDASTTAS